VTKQEKGNAAEPSGAPEGADANTPPDAPATAAELKEVAPVAYSSPLDQKRAEEDAKAYASDLKGAAREVLETGAPGGQYRGPDWNGLPNFYCPYCGFATTAGDTAVHDHIVGIHPDKLAPVEAEE
jgi:hypothetical protein